MLPFEVARRIVHALHLRTLKEWHRFLFSKDSETWLHALQSSSKMAGGVAATPAASSSGVDHHDAGGGDGSPGTDEPVIDWDLQVSIFKIPCRPDKAYAAKGLSLIHI